MPRYQPIHQQHYNLIYNWFLRTEYRYLEMQLLPEEIKIVFRIRGQNVSILVPKVWAIPDITESQLSNLMHHVVLKLDAKFKEHPGASVYKPPKTEHKEFMRFMKRED